MKKSTLNFLIDVLSLIVFIVLIATGAIIRFLLPPGGGYGPGRRSTIEADRFLSMTRHEWGTVHFWFSVIFVILVAVHIILHYRWIKNYLIHTRR